MFPTRYRCHTPPPVIDVPHHHRPPPPPCKNCISAEASSVVQHEFIEQTVPHSQNTIPRSRTKESIQEAPNTKVQDLLKKFESPSPDKAQEAAGL